MKLKKIASLMLAGIMAVSMFAGCKDGASSSTPTEDTEVPATGVSATFYDELSQSAKNLITMSDSSELNAALAGIVEYVSDADANNAFKAGATWNNALSNALAQPDKMNCKVGLSGVKYTKDKATYVDVYAVGQGVNEKAALKVVAGKMDTLISALKAKDTISDGTFEYTYTGSVSVTSKTFKNNSNVDRTVWYVAVMVNQVPTKVANA